MLTQASPQLAQSVSSLPKSFASSIEAFSKLANSPAFSKAAEAFSQLVRIGKKSQQALKAFKKSLAKSIRSKIKSTFTNFKELEKAFSSDLLPAQLRGFLGVAQRLLARLTVHSQSSNSPPYLVA